MEACSNKSSDTNMSSDDGNIVREFCSQSEKYQHLTSFFDAYVFKSATELRKGFPEVLNFFLLDHPDDAKILGSFYDEVEKFEQSTLKANQDQVNLVIDNVQVSALQTIDLNDLVPRREFEEFKSYVQNELNQMQSALPRGDVPAREVYEILVNRWTVFTDVLARAAGTPSVSAGFKHLTNSVFGENYFKQYPNMDSFESELTLAWNRLCEIFVRSRMAAVGGSEKEIKSEVGRTFRKRLRNAKDYNYEPKKKKTKKN